MAQPARARVECRDFPGLATRPDASDLPPGAAVVQENLATTQEGALVTRPGCRAVTFEEE